MADYTGITSAAAVANGGGAKNKSDADVLTSTTEPSYLGLQ